MANSDLEKAVNLIAQKILKEKINQAIKTDVVPTAKKIIQKNINSEVYKKQFINHDNRYASFDFLEEDNLKVYYDENNMSFMIRNETKPKSVFNTPIKSSYEGIFGYWIEMGKVPVLWGPDCEDYIGGMSAKDWLSSGAHSFHLSTKKYSVLHKGKIYDRYFPPRKWMGKTKEYIRSNNDLQEALLKGLNRQNH